MPAGDGRLIADQPQTFDGLVQTAQVTSQRISWGGIFDSKSGREAHRIGTAVGQRVGHRNRTGIAATGIYKVGQVKVMGQGIGGAIVGCASQNGGDVIIMPGGDRRFVTGQVQTLDGLVQTAQVATLLGPAVQSQGDHC